MCENTMKTNRLYKAVIYCRLSKEDGDKVESNSISNQKLYCEDFISKQKDIIIVHSPIVDDGFSGINSNREGFKKVEELARKGEVDCIVVKDLSRFSRSYIDAGTYIEKIFPSLGVRFIAINDYYDTLTCNSASDGFVLPFKNLMNESYCKDISIKVRSSKKTRWKNGDYIGSFCPYGYLKDPENKYQLVVDENVRQNIKLIFSLYKDGLSIGKISDKLNHLSILSPLEYKQSIGINYDTVFKISKVAKWDYKSVQRILTNEVYTGTLVQGKQGTANYKIKKSKIKDEKEWIKVENTHEPIISYGDFYNVKEMMKRDTRSLLNESREEENILSGFVFCGDCGSTMIRKTVPSGSGEKKYVYYVCGNNKNHKICSSHSISTKKLEDMIFSSIHMKIELMVNVEKIINEILGENTEQNINKSFSYEKQILKLEEEVIKYKKIKVRLYEDFVDNIISKDDYKEFKNTYTEKIHSKESAIHRLKKDSQQIVDTSYSGKSWVEIFKEYKNINKLNRRIMMALIHCVKVYENNKIEIIFKYKDEYENNL